MTRRIFVWLACLWGLGVLGVLGDAAAVAQTYPTRPIRVIVPFAPGGSPDIVGRILGQQLSEQMGQPFVVENRSGADGLVGAQLVAAAAPDGYTLLVTSSSFAINPSFHSTMPFDAVKDFEPVTNICAVDAFILGIDPKLPVQNVQDLIAMARKPDNQISFSSPGVGNVLHLAAELFQMRTGTKMVHVPYKSGGQAAAALISGEVQVAFLLPHSSMPYIENGTIRALAYGGRERAPFLPDVPTLLESGVPDMDSLGTWTGLFAPKGTPAPILARLHQEVQKALANPAVRDRLTDLGFRPVGNAPAEFKPYVAAQVARIADIVKASGLEAH